MTFDAYFYVLGGLLAFLMVVIVLDVLLSLVGADTLEAWADRIFRL